MKDTARSSADAGTPLCDTLQRAGATPVSFFCARRVAITSEDEIFTYDNTDDGHGWWTRFTHMVDGGFSDGQRFAKEAIRVARACDPIAVDQHVLAFDRHFALKIRVRAQAGLLEDVPEALLTPAAPGLRRGAQRVDEVARFVADLPEYLGHGGPYVHDFRVVPSETADRVDLLLTLSVWQPLDNMAAIDPDPPELLAGGLQAVRFRYRSLDADGVDEDRIVRGMVGRELSSRFPDHTPRIGEVFFEVRDWTVRHPISTERLVCKNSSFTVRRGESVPDPVTALWKEDLALRVDLQPLSTTEMGGLIRRALGGPVSDRTVARLTAVSGGNVLYARELVMAAAAALLDLLDYDRLVAVRHEKSPPLRLRPMLNGNGVKMRFAMRRRG